MEQETMQTVFVNGVLLHYAVYGEGRPVVLVHGNGEDHRLFDAEVRQLSEAGYRVYAPDSRGHGANEPVAEYHYADMAEDIYRFIQALGLRRPALYGHSDGGIIGLLLALRHPEVLGALAVSGANLSPAGLIPSFLEECAERNRVQPDPLVTLMLTEPDIDPEALRQIAIPVLVTVGEYDLVLPAETARIAAALPRVRQITLAGENHSSYIAGSETMGRLLLDFLAAEWPEGC